MLSSAHVASHEKNPDELAEKVLAFLGTMGIVNVTKPKFYVDINFDAHKAPWAALTG